MRRRHLAAIAAGLAALAAIILEAQRSRGVSTGSVPSRAHSQRELQPNIVEEWGAESFPASDPPQSW